MATLDSSYAIPQNIHWGYSGTKTLQIPYGGTSSRKMVFNSQYYTFHVQYRERQRYSIPALQGIGNSARVVYTPWSAWSGSDTVTASTSKNGNIITYNGHSFSYSYDFTSFDLYEVQFRVRVVEELNQHVSEWNYTTIQAAFAPVGSLSAAYNADGSVEVSVTTDWTRSGSTLKAINPRYCMKNVLNRSLGPYWNYTRWWSGVTVQFGTDDGDGTFAAPAGAVQDGHLYFAEGFGMTTSDGGVVDFSSNLYPGDCAADQYASSGLAIPTIYDIHITAHTDPPGIDEPTLALTPTGDGDLLFTVSDGTYDGVVAWYTWTDSRGVTNRGRVEMSEDSGTWRGIVTAPPYDVTVTVSASVIKSGDWLVRSTTGSVPSNGAISLMHVLTHESVWIYYDSRKGIQRRYNGEVETFKPAGASRPKSRYGDGGTMSLTITGTTPDINTTGGYLIEQGVAAFASAETAGDWLLRIPGGERYSVALMGYALNNAAAPGWYEVSLDLEVVQ